MRNQRAGIVIDNAIRKLGDGISGFLKLESAGGLLLAATASLALICSNFPLRQGYNDLLRIPVVRFGSFAIAKPLLLWINDGLMAIFFLLIGLEVKREIVEGELSTPAQVVLPVVAGAGGMASHAHRTLRYCRCGFVGIQLRRTRLTNRSPSGEEHAAT